MKFSFSSAATKLNFSFQLSCIIKALNLFHSKFYIEGKPQSATNYKKFIYLIETRKWEIPGKFALERFEATGALALL